MEAAAQAKAAKAAEAGKTQVLAQRVDESPLEETLLASVWRAGMWADASGVSCGVPTS